MDDVKSCNSLWIIFTAICLMLMAENFTVATALGGCGASCTSNNDCEGKLACINGVCNDDPTLGTDICGNNNSTQSNNSSSSSSCEPSGYLQGTSHSCNQGGYSDCCQEGQSYPQYECSPPITEATPAILTVNCFEQGGCGGGPSECDNHYHSDQDLVVALSTGWYAGGNRCFSGVTIYGNGQSVTAQVVDECDSVHGCDAEHDYQPPCGEMDVDASPAVWQALGVTKGDSRYGYMNVTWALA